MPFPPSSSPPTPRPASLKPPGRLAAVAGQQPGRRGGKRARLIVLAAVTVVASAVGVGVSAPSIQANTTALNVTVSPPTGTIAVGETITFPVRIENPGTDTATLTSYASSLGDPVTCPTDANIAGGDARLCSTDHVVTATDITNGTLDITVEAEATVSACNVGPLTPELINTTGDAFEFTGTFEGGVTVKGYQLSGRLKDANGNEAARFHIQVESNGAATGTKASLSGNDVTWQFDNVSDANPPSRVRYVINAVTDGFVSGGTITTDGMPPVSNGAVNDATGFQVGFDGQATGAILLAEDQVDEVINANAGDTLTAGTVYNLTDNSVTGAEAPQYTVQYSFNDIANGDRADFWFNQDGTIRYEQHLLSLNLTGCTSEPVTVVGTGSTSVTTWEPGLTVVKNQPTGTVAVGQTIDYSFDVANTGNVELAAIVLDDPLTPDEACPATVLAAGASMTCTATYLVTQADVDAGSIDNTATITGFLPDATTTTTDSSAVSTPITTSGSLTVTKSASPADGVRGDMIDYSIVVTNTGDVTLNAVTVDDPLTTDESCPPGALAPATSVTCTATYVISQADADAGIVSNTATVTALDPSNNPITGTATNDYPVSQNPSLIVTKTADPSGASLGDTITYSILVKNMGDVTVTSPTVDDPLTADESCPAGSIAPDVTITCTGTYVITQADADRGTISNTATAIALDPNGNPVTASGSNVYTVVQTSSLSVTKSGTVPDVDGDGVPQVGDPIEYTITVTNTGSVTIDNIVVTDPIGVPTCDGTSIPGGGIITCTLSRALTQADLDAGSDSNTATAEGTDPGGGAVSATDTAITSISQVSELTVTKSTPINALVADDTINYSIVVHNTGNVTVGSIAISDPIAPDATCPAATLAPGEQMVCTATYVVTQADVDAGTLSNTATVTATAAGGASLSVSSTYTVPSAQTPSLSMVKTGVATDTDDDGMVEPGETIDYTFVVTNTGNVNLSGLAVVDANTNTPVCDRTDVLPGQMATCTASHTLTQTEVNVGVVSNDATATALDPNDAEISASGSTTVTIPMTPELTAAKSGVAVDANDNGQIDVGESIDYTITVTNTGNVTVDTIVVSDPLTGPPTCNVDILDAGAVATCTASYPLTQAAIESGTVTNNAGVTGLDPSDTNITASATTTNTISPIAALTVTKTAAPVDADDSGTIDVGETIDYTITVNNSGNVTVDNVAVSDPTAGNPTCDVTTLASGADAICRVSLTVTQAHLDAGGVTNTATATATDLQGDEVQAQGSVTTPLATTAAISVAKTGTWADGNDDGVPDVGEMIDFTITVTNTGTVTISNLVVTDPTAGDPSCNATTLSPDAAATCTVSYMVDQTDIDAGQVQNTATATGSDPASNPVEGTDTATVSLASAPALSVDKSGTWMDADDDGMVDAGETIDYVIVVTNTGNVTVSNLVVADPIAGDPTCDTANLAPGQMATCLVTYTVTEANIVAGSFDNSANAAGTDPTDGPVSATGGTSTTLTAVPKLGVSKSGTVVDTNDDGITGPGDQIRYTVLVTNSGNVTISNITVDDPMTEPPVCDPTSLAPGASTDCAVLYTLTQADIDSGVVRNTATVNGSTPSGGTVSYQASAATFIDWVPLLEVTKSSTIDSYAVGSVVSYSIVVRNAGNVTLKSISLTDELTSDETCPSDALAPGQQMTCTATYTLTQADIDAGSTPNTATVSALDPDDAELFASGSASTPYVQSPELTMTKTGTANDSNTNGQIDAGDTVSYVILVTNAGNVSVTNVTVTDPKLTNLSCDVADLAPGMVSSCTGSYTLTQVDVDAGSVANTASVTAKDPNLGDVTAEASALTTIVPEPRLSIDAVGIHGDLNDDGVFQANETINYTATVTNTGNVSVDSVIVTESVLGDFTCDVAALAPGDSAICVASTTLTQADIDSGQADIAPVTAGLDPAGEPVVASDPVSTVIPAAPELTVLKSADVTSPSVGDTITYTITVANSGNVTITDLAVTDELTADETCTGTTAAPGATITCTATYVVTQADVDRGGLLNTAVATGSTPAGDPVEGVGEHATPFDQQPSISASKSAILYDPNYNETPMVGDIIDYTISVTNTGNVTLHSVAVDDPITDPPVCELTVLAPGATTDCFAKYYLTADDVDGGGVTNRATARASAPDDSTVTAQASVTTPLPALPELTLGTSGTFIDANQNGVAEVGEQISYTIALRNTGTVTVSDITLTDSKITDLGCDVASLGTGERLDCVAGYTLTPADLDRGEVTNTATATGLSPAGDPVDAEDTVVTTLDHAPAIDLVMSGSMNHPAGSPNVVSIGMDVEYVLVVTNVGNVTLEDVAVTEAMTAGVTCPTTVLASGQQMTCTATYAVTDADMEAGDLVNHGSVTGYSPAGEMVDDVDSVTLPILINPKVDVVKAGTVVDLDQNHVFEPGDSIDFTITVTNTGDVALSELVVDDPLTGAPTCDVTIIAPAEVATCTVGYTITQADIDAGTVSNTASVLANYLEKPTYGTTDVIVPTASFDSATGTVGESVVVDVLGNDSEGLDPTSLRLIDADGAAVLRLEVAGEGVWSVQNGTLVFSPEFGFSGTTTPVTYSVLTVDGVELRSSATATISTTTTTSPTTTTTTDLGNQTATTYPGVPTTYPTPVTTGYRPPVGRPPSTGLGGGLATVVLAALAVLIGAGLLLASQRGRRIDGGS